MRTGGLVRGLPEFHGNCTLMGEFGCYELSLLRINAVWCAILRSPRGKNDSMNYLSLSLEITEDNSKLCLSASNISEVDKRKNKQDAPGAVAHKELLIKRDCERLKLQTRDLECICAEARFRRAVIRDAIFTCRILFVREHRGLELHFFLQKRMAHLCARCCRTGIHSWILYLSSL